MPRRFGINAGYFADDGQPIKLVVAQGGFRSTLRHRHHEVPMAQG
jgi:hypothetical protein